MAHHAHCNFLASCVDLRKCPTYRNSITNRTLCWRALVMSYGGLSSNFGRKQTSSSMGRWPDRFLDSKQLAARRGHGPVLGELISAIPHLGEPFSNREQGCKTNHVQKRRPVCLLQLKQCGHFFGCSNWSQACLGATKLLWKKVCHLPTLHSLRSSWLRGWHHQFVEEQWSLRCHPFPSMIISGSVTQNSWVNHG